MKELNVLLQRLLFDIKSKNKFFYLYSIAFLLLNSLSIFVTNKISSINTYISTNFIICISILCLISLLTLVIKIIFQKQYLVYVCKIDKLSFTKIWYVIFQIFRIFIFQLIIVMLIVIVVLLVFFVPFYFIQFDMSQIMPTKFVAISLLTNIAIFLFVNIWFYRLFFVLNIIIQKRDYYDMSEIIFESKRIIKNNKISCITMMSLQLIFSIPLMLFSYYKFENTIVFVIISIFSMITNLVISICRIYLYQITKLNDKNLQLTTAST